MKKLFSIILSAMLLVVTAFSLTGCGSYKGKEFVYSKIKLDWGKDITNFEKEMILENGDYADEDEFFDEIMRSTNEDAEGSGIKFSDDGKTAFETLDGEVISEGYDVEKKNGHIFLVTELSNGKKTSSKYKMSFGKLTQEISFMGYVDIKIIYKKV